MGVIIQRDSRRLRSGLRHALLFTFSRAILCSR